MTSQPTGLLSLSLVHYSKYHSTSILRGAKLFWNFLSITVGTWPRPTELQGFMKKSLNENRQKLQAARDALQSGIDDYEDNHFWSVFRIISKGLPSYPSSTISGIYTSKTCHQKKLGHKQTRFRLWFHLPPCSLESGRRWEWRAWCLKGKRLWVITKRFWTLWKSRSLGHPFTHG